MPTAVSKRQFRFMQAILHGKAKSHPRGTPPKSVASKYSSPGKDAPEQSGKDRGGTWGEEHHKRAKDKVKEKRKERKEKKKDLKKSFEQYYKGRGVGVVVEDENGKILIGKQNDMGVWTTPGGHVKPDESFAEAAVRELREETGIVAQNPVEVGQHMLNGNDSHVFVVNSFKGKLRDSGEVGNLKFVEPHNIPWEQMRDCAHVGLKNYLVAKLGKSKSLKDMLVVEKLQKNIIRSGVGDVVYEMPHHAALQLVGNGAFRFLRNAVQGMKDEDFKDVHLDNYIISIRKHINDVYSGRISDGQKIVHQFQNRSLPALTAELMSVFEWYLPEDEPELQVLDTIEDDAIEGGMNQLIENYKRHNISNIYQEMENIRTEIRNGMAVDLQQVEAKMMKVFDRMEEFVQTLASKHNQLSREADTELNGLESKLRELQSKIDELSKRPEIVEAFSTKLPDKDSILSNYYMYLSKPEIEISPNGKIRIMFGQDWSPLEKENLLQDMKAKVISKNKV